MKNWVAQASPWIHLFMTEASSVVNRSSVPFFPLTRASLVHDSILFDGVKVGRPANIRRAIIDKGTRRGFVSENVLTNSSPDY